MKRIISTFLKLMIIIYEICIFYIIEVNERATSLSFCILKKEPVFIRWIFSKELYQPEFIEWIYPCIQIFAIFSILLIILMGLIKTKNIIN